MTLFQRFINLRRTNAVLFYLIIIMTAGAIFLVISLITLITIIIAKFIKKRKIFYTGIGDYRLEDHLYDEKEFIALMNRIRIENPKLKRLENMPRVSMKRYTKEDLDKLISFVGAEYQ